MKPIKGLAEKQSNDLKESLAEIKRKLSDAEIEEIINVSQKTIDRQSRPDTKEDLEKIPVLKITDVDPKAEQFRFDIKECSCGATFMKHDIFTNGIVYLKLYFNAGTIPQELLPYASTLSYILGKIHTKNYHYGELSNLTNIHTGGFSYALSVMNDYHIDDKYKSVFSVNAKVLFSKVSKIVDLLSEITLNTVFDDSVRLKEILNEYKSRFEMSLMQSGHMYAASRLSAYISESGKYEEVIGGVELYFFIKQLLLEYDKNSKEVIENYNKVYRMLFNKNNLHVSITSPNKEIDLVKELIKPWIATLDTKVYEKAQYKLDFTQTNEGFVLPGNVQYVAKGYSYKKLGYNYSGDMEVINIIIALDYLWNKIRVQGGAYGAMFNVSPFGNIYTNSYRDPNLAESLHVYNGLGSYINNLELDDREFSKYLIGAVRKFDIPKTPSMKSSISDYYYFINKSQKDIQNQRDQLLNTDKNTMKRYVELLEKVMQKNVFCVFGSEAKVKEKAEIFGKVVNVF